MTTFAGIKRIERAVDLIRREELGQISVGVMPALSGPFISHTNKRFLARYGDAYISVVIRSSQFIVEWLLSKQVDIGLINRNTDNPYIECVPLRGGDLVCIAPAGHRFAAKQEVEPADIDGEPYIGFAADNRIRQKIESTLDGYGTRLNYIMDATLAPAVCEMVANGLGIAIVDPVFAYGQRDHLTIRPFRPNIASDLSLCWLRDTKNRHLVGDARHRAGNAARDGCDRPSDIVTWKFSGSRRIADCDKVGLGSDEFDESDTSKQQHHTSKTQARHRPLREAEPAVTIDEYACDLLTCDSETNGCGSADHRDRSKHRGDISRSGETAEPTPPGHGLHAADVGAGCLLPGERHQHHRCHGERGDEERDRAHRKRRTAKLLAQQRIDGPLDREDRAGHECQGDPTKLVGFKVVLSALAEHDHADADEHDKRASRGSGPEPGLRHTKQAEAIECERSEHLPGDKEANRYHRAKAGK
ncbi:LysR substrate-binding domain-containing protein [Ensifer sp. CCNWLY38]